LPNSSYISSIVCDQSGNIFAGHGSQGIFFSADDGEHWQARNTGMETATIWSMTISPAGVIFAGSTGAIFHSIDLGLHWTADSIGSKDEVLALGADSSGNVFAGVSTGSSYRSSNSGLTWQPFDLYPISAPIRAFACAGQHLYAATWGLGIFESVDTGKDWTVINNGLNSLSIYTMISAPDGNLYAGTSLLGQSEAEVYQMQNTPSAVPHTTVEPLSIEVSPNPFSTQTKLFLSLSSSQMVRLDLCDAVGRIVRTPWDGFLNTGEHEFNLDGKNIESGTYFVRLKYQEGESLIPLVLTH
jgi:ligand-binding sensor domain-containing protein